MEDKKILDVVIAREIQSTPVTCSAPCLSTDRRKECAVEKTKTLAVKKITLRDLDGALLDDSPAAFVSNTQCDNTICETCTTLG